MSNYHFVPGEWALLKNLAQSAENNLYTEPKSSIIQMRLLAESITKSVYALNNLLYPDHQFDALEILEYKQLVDEEILSKFHNIRKAGNKAAHEVEYGDEQIALELNKEVFSLMKWFLNTYSNVDLQHITYQEPVINKEIISTESFDSFKEELDEKLDRLQNDLHQLKTTPSAEKYNETVIVKKSKRNVFVITATIIIFLIVITSIPKIYADYKEGYVKVGFLDRFLLKSEFSFNDVFYLDRALDTAIANNDSERVQSILTVDNLSDKNLNTILIYAIQLENINLITKINEEYSEVYDSELTSIIEVLILSPKNIINLFSSKIEKNHRLINSLFEVLGEDAIQFFINNDLNLDIVLDDGNTFLTQSIKDENTNVIQLLLNHGVQVNKENEEGITPLVFAIQSKNASIIKQLLESGANPNQISNGKYPIEYATTMKLSTITKLLESYGSYSNLDLIIEDYYGYWATDGAVQSVLLKIYEDHNNTNYITFYEDANSTSTPLLGNKFVALSKSSIQLNNQKFNTITEKEFNELLANQTEEVIVVDADTTEDIVSQKNTSSNSSSSSPSNLGNPTEAPFLDREDSLDEEAKLPIHKKLMELEGVWEINKDLSAYPNMVRYLYIVNVTTNYSHNYLWRFHFKTESHSFTEDYVLYYESLEYDSNYLYTSKRLDASTPVKGFVFSNITSTSMDVQYLDHTESYIIKENFIKISPNEIEEYYQRSYENFGRPPN